MSKLKIFLIGGGVIFIAVVIIGIVAVKKVVSNISDETGITAVMDTAENRSPELEKVRTRKFKKPANGELTSSQLKRYMKTVTSIHKYYKKTTMKQEMELAKKEEKAKEGSIKELTNTFKGLGYLTAQTALQERKYQEAAKEDLSQEEYEWVERQVITTLAMEHYGKEINDSKMLKAKSKKEKKEVKNLKIGDPEFFKKGSMIILTVAASNIAAAKKVSAGFKEGKKQIKKEQAKNKQLNDLMKNAGSIMKGMNKLNEKADKFYTMAENSYKKNKSLVVPVKEEWLENFYSGIWNMTTVSIMFNYMMYDEK